jgi:pyruvate dehydrogenase E1 component alpha subunit
MSQSIDDDLRPAQAHPAAIDREQWLQMYEQMLTIRVFEEQVNALYTGAKMPGLAHLYIGQEAVAVGVCTALRRDDYITSTHRGHGHCLAKGAAVDRMFAELLGKAAGYCRGKGGSMHIADQDSGNLGANAIVGGSAGIAWGCMASTPSTPSSTRPRPPSWRWGASSIASCRWLASPPCGPCLC